MHIIELALTRSPFFFTCYVVRARPLLLTAMLTSKFECLIDQPPIRGIRPAEQIKNGLYGSRRSALSTENASTLWMYLYILSGHRNI
jgi:hypothetical protein